VNKATRILLAIGLILAVATPALAEFKISGYYRLMAYSAEVRSGGGTVEGGYASNSTDEEGDSRQMIDQRLRMMVTNQLNDNVGVVWHGEVDTPWGETSKGAIGGGGQVGADGVNVETKNVYLDLKSGDTSARLGIQTLFDAYQGIVFFDDMAGLAVTHKMGATTLTAAYSKWDEDSNRSDWDDLDFYVADVKHKFSDNFALGGSVYFYDDNDSNGADTQQTEIFFFGLNADWKINDQFALNGYVLGQSGEVDNKNIKDVDTEAMAASAKATMKLEGGDLGLRVIYFSEDDDDKDQMNWKTPQGRYDFVSENLMQMLTDKFVCNYGKERYAMADAAEAGYGLLAFVASGNHKLPQGMYLNWGAGYFMAMDDERNDEASKSREGDTIGYEVAARVGKKYFEKVDVSLNLSYAGYGDFYDNTAPGSDDPDGTYKSYLMVNVPF
jgi:hypothetical protein